MSETPRLLEANKQYAASYTKGKLPMPPSRHVAVITCMDARLHPEKFLGLQEGEAHMIRNAGGRASDDAIRSLVISQQLLGTNEVVVIHHEDCGMLTFTNEQLREKLHKELKASAAGVDFLPFTNLEQSVRDDVARIRSSPLIAKGIPIGGYIYDVHTGRLTEVR